ncbi:hypothetical protein [Nisaea sediminum]|uniref:hypothetical protein n=1 Tax=Nisaea sediminum TaxID=2775867 RepID=UPI001868F265|nr:hypothetical protein [Nisaea sediminum]
MSAGKTIKQLTTAYALASARKKSRVTVQTEDLGAALSSIKRNDALKAAVDEFLELFDKNKNVTRFASMDDIEEMANSEVLLIEKMRVGLNEALWLNAPQSDNSARAGSGGA